MKKIMANNGLVHWLNLILIVSPTSDDFHSSDVIVGTDDISAWTAFHPGQKLIIFSF